MRACALVALLACSCGDERQSYEAPAGPLSVHRTTADIAFEWNGPTPDYPSAIEAGAAIDAAFGQWVNEGWLRPEPFMVHYADTVHARTFFVSLVPAAAVDGLPFTVEGNIIAVAMIGDYQEPSTGLVYQGIGRLKLAWDEVNGLR